jgi:endo-1,3(4)-beta-glucanase
MLTGDQRLPVYPVPYALAWTGCARTEKACHHGIGVWHSDSNSVIFGEGNPAEYYYNPTHLHQLVLSAAELKSNTVLSANNTSASSIIMSLSPSVEETPVMDLPLVQGMGFVTAVYHNATPTVSSLVGFKDFTHAGRKDQDGSVKYVINLVDGATWVLYVIPTVPSYVFHLVSEDANTYTTSNRTFDGIIQLAKLNTETKSSYFYDRAYGAYPVDATISGSVTDNKGDYTISWTKEGFQSRELLMFALPHQMESSSLQTIVDDD